MPSQLGDQTIKKCLFSIISPLYAFYWTSDKFTFLLIAHCGSSLSMIQTSILQTALGGVRAFFIKSVVTR